tara:strand:- start:99 stop:458 length:360 start_codon:yes stop_codon:yes gene_type:complete
LNFEFSNPLRVNELFRPILQELMVKDNIDLEELEYKLILNIKNTFKKYNKFDFNRLNFSNQIIENLKEAINLLFLNNLINKDDENYSLTVKSKFHIQSLDPIKITGFSGNVEFIMDFLP